MMADYEEHYPPIPDDIVALPKYAVIGGMSILGGGLARLYWFACTCNPAISHESHGMHTTIHVANADCFVLCIHRHTHMYSCMHVYCHAYTYHTYFDASRTHILWCQNRIGSHRRRREALQVCVGVGVGERCVHVQ